MAAARAQCLSARPVDRGLFRHRIEVPRVSRIHLMDVRHRHAGAVAGAVGYESEAAFSRAFKKLVGQAPATWRRGNDFK
jgi:transcriptional regulator GlxA family with amidase domain